MCVGGGGGGGEGGRVNVWPRYLLNPVDKTKHLFLKGNAGQNSLRNSHLFSESTV